MMLCSYFVKMALSQSPQISRYGLVVNTRCVGRESFLVKFSVHLIFVNAQFRAAHFYWPHCPLPTRFSRQQSRAKFWLSRKLFWKKHVGGRVPSGCYHNNSLAGFDASSKLLPLPFDMAAEMQAKKAIGQPAMMPQLERCVVFRHFGYPSWFLGWLDAPIHLFGSRAYVFCHALAAANSAHHISQEPYSELQHWSV